MAGRDDGAEPSMRDQPTKSDPLTHCFYEYQGERSVEPELLIENGVSLWHEHVDSDDVHDNSYLWAFATSLLENREATPMYSWIEWVRYQITLGSLTPPQWDSRKPYPYKGLLISAIYLQEARSLCEKGQAARAWHLVALAYYHLGLGTGSGTVRNTSRAAMLMHAARTEEVRALVLGALQKMRADESIRGLEATKDRVVEILRELGPKAQEWLARFDSLVPENTKGRSDAPIKNDVFDRVRNMLDTWAAPAGPYPEIAEAFSHFKRMSRASNPAVGLRKTSGQLPADDSECFLRVINFFEDGGVLTIRISEADDA